MTVKATLNAALKGIENLFHALVTDVDHAIEPGLAYLKANVPAAAISLAETALVSAATGTPWASVVATFLTQAEAAGLKLAESAATVALNTAQNNLIAAGTATGAAAPVTLGLGAGTATGTAQ